MPFLPQSTLQMKYERWFFETLSCTKGRGKTSERGAFIRFLGLLEENFETISVFLRFGVSVTDDLLMLYLIVLLFFRWKIMSKSSRFQIFQFFSRFQIPSHIIYIYLNIKYLYSIKKGICPSFFNWKNWKWKEYSRQVSIPTLMIHRYLNIPWRWHYAIQRSQSQSLSCFNRHPLSRFYSILYIYIIVIII